MNFLLLFVVLYGFLYINLYHFSFIKNSFDSKDLIESEEIAVAAAAAAVLSECTDQAFETK